MGKEMHIAWISNITFEPYLRVCINSAFSPVISSVQLDFIIYDEIYKKYDTVKNAEIIVVCLELNELYPKANRSTETESVIRKTSKDIYYRVEDLYSFLKENTKAKIIWFGFEDYSTNNSILYGAKYELFGLVDRVNIMLCKMLSDDVFVDLKRIIALCGIGNSFSKKGKYRWNAPYSKMLIKHMANEIYKQYLINSGQTKKCIVLDCDNVLWGGSISEDGIEGISLGKSGFGRAYYDFQNFIITLYKHGVILAICSKNDLSDVLQVFQKHSEMALKEKHIACFMANWENKASNIKRIAEYLNIGLDSIVFVDDSPIEIESVKANLPEVTTIQFKKYMDYEPFACFNLRSKYSWEEVKKRTKTYQTNTLRNKLKSEFTNNEGFIQSLNVVVDIHKAVPEEFNRISELTQRTNKCTNGRRYTTGEIKERNLKPNISLYSVSVSDRFSDLGLVAAMEIEDDCLTLFSLSCRALGRNVERAMIDYLLANNQICSFDYYSTNKNKELKKILTDIIDSNTI